jgi:5-methylcytosine-specific restriction endonuclease McrA
MSKYIPESLRQAVALRANFRCEYCRRYEADSFIKFQIDHIISQKHGGLTILSNLAYTCYPCNHIKGSDIGTVLSDDETFVRLFNPRKHNWFDHFELSPEGLFVPKTQIAEGTIKVLDLNNVNRIMERIDLIAAGLLP